MISTTISNKKDEVYRKVVTNEQSHPVTRGAKMTIRDANTAYHSGNVMNSATLADASLIENSAFIDPSNRKSRNMREFLLALALTDEAGASTESG